ncbi:MAG TPA: AraC family transcriptional regulator [Chryseolinea sp.]|nr:AraC family transcriptional regulator [Chryseolinea sp.]HPH47392.1 AraC family transcriptional regulator [Chryseolinea sp.]HPM31194.1 AraC family transcriptional regulator [Chryseolinea sp.]
MTRDIVEINDFIVLIEQSIAEEKVVDQCGFEDQVIGFSFYGSGNVELDIHYGKKTKKYSNTKGIALSFSANSKVQFVHNISSKKPLQCICVVSSIKNIQTLPKQEVDVFAQYLHELINPQDHYVEGPIFYMSPDMQSAVDKIFSTSYTGTTRMMFIRSQVMELLSHFFAIISQADHRAEIKNPERHKLYEAKEILSNNMEAPPSLSELSKLIGLNSFKLKKSFKELFGVPVFKYLQHERLNKAHELLTHRGMSIQEVAGLVGYESISSFSSAFLKKFGQRPSEIRK